MTQLTTPISHDPESVMPTKPVEFYTDAVKRLECLVAAFKAHPGPAHLRTALRAVQVIGNACYALQKCLDWLNRKPEED